MGRPSEWCTAWLLSIRENSVLLEVRSFVRDFARFLWVRKLWWMVPMVAVFLLFGVLVFLAQSSAVAPFVYVLF